MRQTISTAIIHGLEPSEPELKVIHNKCDTTYIIRSKRDGRSIRFTTQSSDEARKSIKDYGTLSIEAMRPGFKVPIWKRHYFAGKLINSKT